MWWNIFGDPDDPDAFAIASAPLFTQFDTSPSWPGGGRHVFGLDADLRLSQMRKAGLIHTEFRLLRWSLAMDTAQIRALAATFSQVIQADHSRRAEFLDSLGKFADETFGGMVQRRFLTAFYIGQKPP